MLDSTPGRWQKPHGSNGRVHKDHRRRNLLWIGLLALLVITGLLATSPSLLAADAIALSEPWRFVDESKPGAPLTTGTLENVAVDSAADAPTQVAARFNISSTMQALALQLNSGELGGLPLAQVEEMSYCTRLVDGPRPYAVTLQINLDADVTDSDQSWQGRLVYTPSYNGAVIQGEWQCWNTLVGKWWATGGPVAAYAPLDNPQPLGTLLARFPNLGINDSYSVVALKAGDGWSSFQGEASPVVIGVEGARIEIAFGMAPQTPQQSNEILLPVLLNQTPEPAQEPQDKPQDKPQKNEDKKDPKDRWPATDWGNGDWANFDWESFDWEKVDWDHLDWGAFGWGGFGLDPAERTEAVRAFVEDVKQCKANGWQGLGFDKAGDCVAYYIKAHLPADWQWRYSAGYNSDNHDGYDNDQDNNQDNDHSRGNRRGHRGNDD